MSEKSNSAEIKSLGKDIITRLVVKAEQYGRGLLDDYHRTAELVDETTRGCSVLGAYDYRFSEGEDRKSDIIPPFGTAVIMKKDESQGGGMRVDLLGMTDSLTPYRRVVEVSPEGNVTLSGDGLERGVVEDFAAIQAIEHDLSRIDISS